MPVRFLITTLKLGIDPQTYEQWVRDRDYPFVASLPNIVSYQVHRIRGDIAGAEGVGWMYLERIEMRSLEQHAADLATPAGQKIRDELYEFLDRRKNVAFASDVV